MDGSEKTMEHALDRDWIERGRFFILQGVSPESVLGLLERCKVRELAEGDVLLASGQANSTMYMVLDGSLGVFLDAERQHRVTTLDAGQVVGEISVIEGSTCTAHVAAVGPTRVLAVDEDTFWSMVEASHAFSINLLRLLASRMRAADFALSEGERTLKRLERDALSDGLTGLYNRRWLDERLPRLVRRHEHGHRPMSVLMIDVDHFKRFNDEHGHAAGDRVLAGVAVVLMTRLRPTDLVARYGGEEFTVMLPETDLAGALVAAERLRLRIPDDLRARFGEELPVVTVSIGAAEMAAGDDAGALLSRADKALYRAKRAGRDRVES